MLVYEESAFQCLELVQRSAEVEMPPADTELIGHYGWIPVFLGQIQDRAVVSQLEKEQPALHQQVVAEKVSVLGAYQAVDPHRLKELGDAQKETVNLLTQKGSKSALATMAIFPVSMMLGYIALFVIFRRRGGYTAVNLQA